MNKFLSSKFKILSFYFTVAFVLYHAQYHPLLVNDGFDSFIYYRTLNLIILFSDVAMAYFFQTSAYLLYVNLTEENFGEKMKRRVKSLLIPFVIWNVLGLLKVCVTDGIPRSKMTYITHFSIDPFDGPMWYVLVVFLLGFLAKGVYKLFVKNRRLCLIVLAILAVGFVVISCLSDMIDACGTYGWYLTRLFRFIPCYLVGIILALYKSHWLTDECSVRVREMSCVIIGLVLVEYVCGISTIEYIFMPTLFFLAISGSEALIQKSKRNVFQISFLLYACHTLLLPSSQMVYQWFPELSGVQSLCMRMICAAVIIVLVRVIHRVAKRYCPRIIGIISGGRV